MFTINLESRIPIYEQLYKKIVELIIKKELNPKDQLPSVRILAKEFGINPNTVSKAYNELEHDGIIYTLAGRGSFVADTNIGVIRDKVLENFDQSVNEAININIKVSELIDRLKMKEGELA